MDSAICRLKIATLNAQIELCRITCAALENVFIRPDQTPAKRMEVFRLWGIALRECEGAQNELAILELGERETAVEADSNYKISLLHCNLLS